MIIFIIFLIIIFILSLYNIIPTYIYKLKNKLDYKKRKNGKNIYLTFDDGPNKKYTKMILDLLKKYNVKATFFTVASFAENNPKIIKEMIKDGHIIGYHSYSHKNPWFKSYKEMKNEFTISNKIYKKLGINIKFFRPSWGRFNISSLILCKKYKYKIVLWDVMAEDWKESTEMIKYKLLKRIKDECIICLHDNRGINNAPLNTIKALEEAIPILLNKGYNFKKVDDLYE